MMKRIKMLMFKMKIPLVVIEQYCYIFHNTKKNTPVNTMSATTHSVEQSHPTKNYKILYHFTPDSGYTEVVFFLEQGLSKWEKQKMV